MKNSDTIRTIRNIWAVGRNYADHAKELGNQAPAPQGVPMIFMKAGSSIVENGATFSLPSFSKDIHHELEIALQFGPDLRWKALSVALDLTARDIQNELKAKAHPWTLAKSFRNACLLGPLVPVSEELDPQNLGFSLHINGELRQKGHTRDMIHPIEKLRLYILDHFPVTEGDLLLTGTPAGVGPLAPNDHIEATAGEGLIKAHWHIAP